jgi:hypothetical protein
MYETAACRINGSCHLEGRHEEDHLKNTKSGKKIEINRLIFAVD